MEEALILSPSSYGLQPWTFVVITDQKMRERLFPSTWNQRQILDCSHFVVFTARKKIMQEDIDRHVARTADLTAKRLASVVCCAAGYRSAEDKNAGQKKVRFARTDVIHIV